MIFLPPKDQDEAPKSENSVKIKTEHLRKTILLGAAQTVGIC